MKKGVGDDAAGSYLYVPGIIITAAVIRQRPGSVLQLLIARA